MDLIELKRQIVDLQKRGHIEYAMRACLSDALDIAFDNEEGGERIREYFSEE